MAREKRRRNSHLGKLIAELIQNQVSFLTRVSAMDERIAQLEERLTQIEQYFKQVLMDHDRKLAELRGALERLPEAFRYQPAVHEGPAAQRSCTIPAGALALSSAPRMTFRYSPPAASAPTIGPTQ